MHGSDILREVDESLRAEKAAQFWKKNGKTLVALGVALVLGTAAQSAWTSYQKNQSQIATSKFLDALKEKEPVAALQALSADAKSSNALAGLNGAAISISKKDWPAAIKFYQDVSAMKSAPATYKDLALTQLAAVQLDHAPEVSAADLLKTIQPVIDSKDSPWQSRALFISALIKGGKSQDWSGARADLQKILSSPNLASSFEEQVKSLDQVYQIRETQKGSTKGSTK